MTRSWEYDTFGMKKKAISGGFIYTYEYRPDGKLLKKSSSGRPLLTCTYDKNGALKTLTDITGKTLHYGYDWRGNLSYISAEGNEKLVEYSHWPDGKLKSIYHKNGTRTIYEYDTDGNISRLATYVSDNQPLFDFQYDYDLNGNRIAKSGSRIVLGTETGEPGLKGEASETRIANQYDALNRLIQESYDGENISYEYDYCGNRIGKESVAGKETYCYNGRNQLTERKTQGTSWVYRYDKQGNILEEQGKTEKRRYEYNPFGEQTEVIGDNFRYENFYDGEFLRAGTAVNGKASRFIYYNGELQAETEEDQAVSTRYILGYGVAGSERKNDTGIHTYHLDEQNSTAYITGEHGQIENFYEYDAFGVIRQKSEEIKSKILYTGQQYDQETEQYYLRARYYNPVIGRFLQEDVYRGDGLNLYAYCGNNPVVYYDPSGYASLTLLPNELQIGSYKDLLKKYGPAGKTLLTPHHMASAEFMLRNYGVDKNDGLSMLVETTYKNSGGRHGKTSTYGTSSMEYYNLTPRQALARDVNDMRNILKDQGLYDKYAKRQLKEYIKIQEDTKYSTSPKNQKNSKYTGKVIKDEKIFSKEYEQKNNKKNNKKTNCKEG